MNETMMEMMHLLSVNAANYTKGNLAARATKSRGDCSSKNATGAICQVAGESSAVNESRSESLLSLPPMYSDQASLPRFSAVTETSAMPESPAIPTSEAMQQNYAAAYQEALRVLSQQASMAALQQVATLPAQKEYTQLGTSSHVQVIDEESDIPTPKDPKKRLLDEEDGDERTRNQRRRELESKDLIYSSYCLRVQYVHS